MDSTKRITAAALACLLLAGCSAEDLGALTGYTADTGDDGGDHTGYVGTLTPANDYYGYINGKELMEMELDAKHSSMGTMDEVADLVDDQLDALITETANSEVDFPKGSNEQLIHDLYHLTKDDFDGELDTDAADTQVIDGILERIEAAQDVDGLVEMWRGLTLDYGLYTFLTVTPTIDLCDTTENVFQAAYSSPVDLESIRESDFGAVAARDQLADCLRAAGVPYKEATDRATDIVYALYEIAGHTDMEILSGEKTYIDTFNLYTAEELSDHMSGISFEDLIYISGHSGDAQQKISVSDPDQLFTMVSLVDEDHVRVWKDLAICVVMDGYSEFLPDKYRYSQKADTSSDELAKELIKSLLDKQLGELYAQRYYTEEKRKVITQICDDMKAEYYVLIDGADWLSDEGKKYLTDKLDKMKFYIGADEPHETDPKDADLIGGSILQTCIRVQAGSILRQLSTIGEVPERNGFDTMAPHTINACYLSPYNCVNITAAITNAPIYIDDAEYAATLGRIGSIIGHEISHAFDSEGVLFDADGNYRPDAMPEADRLAFEKKQEQAIKYYDRFTVLGSHVNGKLTLAENLADISGLQCVLAIADGPEEQKTALENYAKVWMTLTPDTDAKMLLELDEHSPALVRVNAVVANFDEFYEIYGVKEGDPMYIAPEERVRRW
ncbi:MAG: M13 family metallopeptidase [Oscillospiraceae bacterium]|nr:M13 family metallopeptidase [Oscillospiraceae bacterium]